VLHVLTAAGAGAALVLAAMTAVVRRRGGARSGVSLAIVLASAAWWAACYAMEVASTDPALRGMWGDLKYPGIVALPPALLVFVLRYTGHDRLVTRRLLVLLAVVPVLVCAVLANPATHDLIRYYKTAPGDGQTPLVGSGPLFWVLLAYANAVLLTATAVLLRSMWRLSRTYRVAAATVMGAALLPWVANVLYNFEIGPFARVDLTPLAFTVTGAVLVTGLYRERLIDLDDVGWGMAVATTPNALLLCDAFGHVTNANAAATRLLGGGGRGPLVGQDLTSLLPALGPAPAPHDPPTEPPWSASAEIPIDVDGQPRWFHVARQSLPSPEGVSIGELVVLMDVTDRRVSETRLQELLEERTRVAATLRSALLPAHLPSIPGCELGTLYEPAGGPNDVGGDFYDAFAIDGTRWGVLLGDVSGKGATAGALTTLIRYTVRTLAQAHREPSEVLHRLNAILLRDLADEQFCTLVYAVAEPTPQGLSLVMCLGGHHQPLLRQLDGSVAPVGDPGTAPGLTEDPTLTDCAITMRPGEQLCLFTDGLVEARHEGDFFGVERVERLLAHRHEGPQSAADALGCALHRFQTGAPSDDVAVLVIEASAPGLGSSALSSVARSA
jgi:sigma-B regulation protein RsbU (phosphoserine phosphatase)